MSDEVVHVEAIDESVEAVEPDMDCEEMVEFVRKRKSATGKRGPGRPLKRGRPRLNKKKNGRIPGPLAGQLRKMINICYSYNEIARRLGVKMSSVHNWYTGKTKPGLQTLMRAERLGLLDAKKARPELWE